MTPRRSSERANPVRRSAAHELVDGGDAKRSVDLGVELLAQGPLDARAQLGDGVELARGARELVVDLGQHLLLDLANGDLDVRARAVRERKGDLLGLPRRRSCECGVDLRREPAAAELDDRIGLRLAVGVDEVDEKRVAWLCGPLARRCQLGDRLAKRLDLGIHGLLRNVDLGSWHLERRPVDELG